SLPAGRVRRPGAGRKPLTRLQPGLLPALEALVEPTCRGDLESPLRWSGQGVRGLAAQLRQQGFRIGRQKVAELLRDLAYSLQANRKTREGSRHPDRDAQFAYLAARVRDFPARRQPAISVDTKKKGLVGDFQNGGRQWRPKGQPEEVRVHDFVGKELGKAIPYGVYDLAAGRLQLAPQRLRDPRLPGLLDGLPADRFDIPVDRVKGQRSAVGITQNVVAGGDEWTAQVFGQLRLQPLDK